MKKMKLLFVLLFLVIGACGYIHAQTTVVMNEIYSRGVSTDPDWIEIYNTTATAVDISGYKIYDIGGQGGTKPKKEFPTGSIVPAKGFLVIVVDDADASGFGLSSSGEKVWFENKTGVIIDTITFPAYTATQSYARVPDGSSAWQIVNTITKGATNGGGTAVNDRNMFINNFAVFQNFPNPFNPSTSISYIIPAGGNVSVKVFDVMGKEVKLLVNEYQSAGLHSVNFDAGSLSSGVYYYSVKSGSYSGTKKLLLLK